MPVSSKPTQVLIVDDHELVRKGLRQVIEADSSILCCGEAGTEREARQFVEQLQPEIVIVDLTLEEGDGIEFVKWLRERYPAIHAIVVSAHEETLYAPRALKAGAKGYIQKKKPSGAVVEAVRAVRMGKTAFSAELLDQITKTVIDARQNDFDPIALLSDRELQIFASIGKGATSSEIATALNLSRSTVDTYRERIKAKLNINNTNELARRAFDWDRQQHDRKPRPAWSEPAN